MLATSASAPRCQSDNGRVTVKVRVSLQKFTKNSDPEKFWLKKAWQDEYGTASTLVLTQLSYVQHRLCCGAQPHYSGVIKIKVQFKLLLDFRVQRDRKHTGPETLGQQIGCQDEYNTAPALLCGQLSHCLTLVLWTSGSAPRRQSDRGMVRVKVRVRLQKSTKPSGPEKNEDAKGMPR